MDPAIEAQIKQLEESEFYDPTSAETLAGKAAEWKETCPGDALRIFRILAILADKYRFHRASEKLHFHAEAAELGWKLNDPLLDAARLQRWLDAATRWGKLPRVKAGPNEVIHIPDGELKLLE
jgi:hypothetical protein